MSYIDRESLERKIHTGMTIIQAMQVIIDEPAADVVPVVRCRECVMWEEYENTAGCGYCRNKRFVFRYGGAVGGNEREFKPITEPGFSCSDGKRKGGDEAALDVYWTMGEKPE
ncbi:MAG: hypothetical protein IJS55_03255 [Oscillospiraceae bacterium]|nr:hypothetical protein [Oscillospiraceae bacterium]